MARPDLRVARHRLVVQIEIDQLRTEQCRCDARYFLPLRHRIFVARQPLPTVRPGIFVDDDVVVAGLDGIVPFVTQPTELRHAQAEPFVARHEPEHRKLNRKRMLPACRVVDRHAPEQQRDRARQQFDATFEVAAAHGRRQRAERPEGQQKPHVFETRRVADEVAFRPVRQRFDRPLRMMPRIVGRQHAKTGAIQLGGVAYRDAETAGQQTGDRFARASLRHFLTGRRIEAAPESALRSLFARAEQRPLCATPIVLRLRHRQREQQHMPPTSQLSRMRSELLGPVRVVFQVASVRAGNVQRVEFLVVQEPQQTSHDMVRDVLESEPDLIQLVELRNAPTVRIAFVEERRIQFAAQAEPEPRRRHELGVCGKREATLSNEPWKAVGQCPPSSHRVGSICRVARRSGIIVDVGGTVTARVSD